MDTTPLYEKIAANLPVVFIVILYFFYVIVYERDVPKVLFSTIILYVVYTLYERQKVQEATKTNDVDKFIDYMEEYLSNEHELNGNIFGVHKTPKKLRYLRRNGDIKNILYDLKFLKIYDMESLSKTTAYLEYFLKIHYMVMINEYDYGLFYPILKDIRNALLNIMKSTVYNTPNISTILDIPDIDAYIQLRTLRIQSITYKFLKILHKKFKNKVDRCDPPFEHDPMATESYDMY